MKKLKKTSKVNKIKMNTKRTRDPLKEDLSDFILEGGWHSANFELREKKDKVLSLRISEKLLNELKKKAEAMGLDTQKFIRIVLESSIREKAG